MNAYRTVLFPGAKGIFSATLAEAKRDAVIDKGRRTMDLTRVFLVDVPTDKESVVECLNGKLDFPVLRTWRVSPRGALIEANVAAKEET